MAETTNFQVHYTEHCNTIINDVLTPILELVNSRPGPYTMDQLVEKLHMPSTKGRCITPAIPSMAFGAGVVPSVVSSIAPTNSRKTTVTANPQQGRTCNYQLKRGAHKGQYCGKNVAPGNEYCASCLKRPALNKELASKGMTPGVAPGVIPGMAGIPTGYSSSQSDNGDQGSKLTVVPFDQERGLFKDIERGFIVYQSESDIIVIGKHDENTDTILQLTDQEKIVAQQVGLMLPSEQSEDSEGEFLQQSVPSPESSSSIPQANIANNETYQSVVPNVPRVNGVLPSIPQLGSSIPNIQASLGGIPQIPSIHNV